MTEAFIALTFQDFTEETRIQRNALAQSQIAAYLTYGESLHATMDVLAENVCQATGCSACAVTLVYENPLRQQVIGAWAEAPEHGDLLRSLCSCDDSLPMEVWRTGCATVKSDDIAARSDVVDGLPSDLREALKECPWGSGVSLPLRYQGVGLGTLNCLYGSGYVPDELEMRFLQTIADQAAVAVENARLFAEVQGKAALEERQRLARDLHDSVSQALYGIGLGAHTALKRLKNDPQGAVVPLEYVLSLASTGLAEMRALIFDLRPDALESEGLVVMLRHQLHALNARLGVEVVDDLQEVPELATTSREAVYRVAREAMVNVVKHASASRLEVTLRVDGGFVVLTVMDDGVGFDLQQKFPGHLGLTSMRERVASVGGDLSVVSAPGQGTVIRAQVPVQS